MNKIMDDLEYAKWCMLNELDRLAIPDDLRNKIQVVIEHELQSKTQVEEKAKVLKKVR